MAFAPGPGIIELANELAGITGLNNWQLNECSYNGAQFHWMQPSYNGLNPVGALEEFIQQEFDSGSNQKPNYGTWANVFSMQDRIDRKLCVFPVPNMNGYYIDDFGNSGATISIVGLVYGPSYLQVLDNCSQAFLDTQAPIGSTASVNNTPQGLVTGDAFRTLEHIIYGPIQRVYLKDYTILTKSDKYQAAAFELTLIASDPSYLYVEPSNSSFQIQLQEYLAAAEALILGINQTFSLGQQLNNNISFLGDPGPPNPIYQISVINGTGQYLNSVIAEITEKLLQVSQSFINCMAFLAQNNGGIISNSFWNAITINYSVIPLYLTPGQAFSQGDAQVIITTYQNVVNDFLQYANENIYISNIQNNVFAISQGLVVLNNFAQTALTQNAPVLTVKTNRVTDLYTLMFNNDQNFSNFESIVSANAGSWFSCLTIPSGTVINL